MAAMSYSGEYPCNCCRLACSFYPMAGSSSFIVYWLYTMSSMNLRIIIIIIISNSFRTNFHKKAFLSEGKLKELLFKKDQGTGQVN